jgi:hypothetical protein
VVVEGQPITLALPTQVKVKLGCDSKASESVRINDIQYYNDELDKVNVSEMILSLIKKEQIVLSCILHIYLSLMGEGQTIFPWTRILAGQ